MDRAIIGTAGWGIASGSAYAFPAEGTALERYCAVFAGVEINSSFHRPHRASTWEKWAQAVPDKFQFSAKLPKTITHQAKLVDCDELVARFSEELKPLGEKLRVLLVQLPPKLAFDKEVANDFFSRLRPLSSADIACEPRNASWFTPEADELLKELGVARVAADPSLSEEAARPGGWRGLSYWRLHGSPRIYRSPYGDDALERYAVQVSAASESGKAWCMFDNTAGPGATANALCLMEKLDRRSGVRAGG